MNDTAIAWLNEEASRSHSRATRAEAANASNIRKVEAGLRMIVDLEREKAALEADLVTACASQRETANEVTRLDREKRALEAECDRLREALRFYADADTWVVDPDRHTYIPRSPAERDSGYKAKAALLQGDREGA